MMREEDRQVRKSVCLVMEREPYKPCFKYFIIFPSPFILSMIISHFKDVQVSIP